MGARLWTGRTDEGTVPERPVRRSNALRTYNAPDGWTSEQGPDYLRTSQPWKAPRTRKAAPARTEPDVLAANVALLAQQKALMDSLKAQHEAELADRQRAVLAQSAAQYREAYL